MRILIISPPRCGSTSLSLNLAKILNYKVHQEPFNYRWWPDKYSYPIEIENNSIVRTITYQVPKEFGKPNDFIKFIIEFKNQFDKIILLSRRNKQKHLESYANLIVKNTLKQSVYQKWNMNEIKDKLKDFKYEQIQPHVDSIHKLSQLINIPITYYEDLYGQDRDKSLEIIKSWKINMNFNKLNELSNPKFKLRIENKII